MNKSTQNDLAGDNCIEQAVRAFSYFDLALNQLNIDSKKSFAQSLFIFKKVSESIKSENVLMANEFRSKSDDLFTKKLAFCKARLTDIITLLQFEDILTQKFDHISQINQILIDVLQHNTELTTEKKSLLLKKIIFLNSAQLEYMKDEHKAIYNDLKNKLEDIYKALKDILLIIQTSEKGNIQRSNYTASIESSIKLIRSFIDTDIVKFSFKIDALIKIFEGLDINVLSNVDEKLKEFDLQQLLKIYTIESERIVFKRVFAGDEGNLTDIVIAASSDKESIHLF